MPSLRIQLDDATYRALNQVVPAARRLRTEFIRKAIKAAIRRREFAHMRQAYTCSPDTPADADDWANVEVCRL